jgi:hypothetical protein
MNIALPILLLVFGGLTFWILNESKLKWYLKTACITTFCLFTIIFWTSIHTFLGWPADEEDMPNKILIHWVIVKEPNKFEEFDGGIFILLETMEELKANRVARFFGYGKNKMEPRLFELKYNRELHEQLQKVKGKLQQGQPVAGKLTKEGEKGKGKNGKGKQPNKKGEGSESQEQDWQFHELLPSEIHSKPQD